MTEPQRVTRFQKQWYRQWTNEPVWHLAVRDYDKNLFYTQIHALCGYSTNNILGGVRISNAIRPPKGKQCQRCLEKEQL